MVDGGVKKRIAAALLWALSLLAGCRGPQYVPDHEYARLDAEIEESHFSADPAGEALSPVVADLAGPHSVETYVAHALQQNPDIQAARKRVEAAALEVPQAASLRDPTLKLTAYPEQVQTAAGQQELQIGVQQHIPWLNKLETRAALAEEEAERQRAALAAVELAVIEKVKRAYYELYYLQQTIRTVESDKNLLKQYEEIVREKYQNNQKAFFQDLLRVQLESSLRDDELTRLKQQQASAQARLARLLHVSPDTPVQTVDRLPEESLPDDLDRLYRMAVKMRPELQAHLWAVERDRRGVELAQLEYYPDVTLGLNWIDTASAGISPVSNGNDAVMLSAAVNLPVYRGRIEAGINQAEARAVASARQYDSLRDQTLEEVKDFFTQIASQRDLLRLLSDDIIPKAKQTLEVSKQAYAVGTVDFLQVIDNWRRLLRFQIARQKLQSQLRQTLARLEQVVGGSLSAPANAPEDDAPQPAPPQGIHPLPPIDIVP